MFPGRGDIQPQLDSALQDVNDKYLLLEETEKQAVRKALIEERGRFCTFVSMLRPVIVSRRKLAKAGTVHRRGSFLLGLCVDQPVSDHPPLSGIAVEESCPHSRGSHQGADVHVALSSITVSSNTYPCWGKGHLFVPAMK